MDLAIFNILLLGFTFLLVFTSFQTCAMLQETVLENAQNETGVNFNGAGYYSLSIIYGVLAVSNWISPAVVAIIGPKFSIFFSAIVYNLYVASFFKPAIWSLYLGSVLLGFAAAVLWTAQGTFLSINSTHETMSRNSGIFWAIFQSSLIWGNLYQYISFSGVTSINATERTRLYLVLTSTCFVGVFLMLGYRKTSNSNVLLQMNERESTKYTEALAAFKGCFKLLKVKLMINVLIASAFTGFSLTFFSGVYGTMMGHNKQFGEKSNSYIGLSGIFIGGGEIAGGVLFTIFGKKTTLFGRDPIIMLAYVLYLVAYYLCFINLPADSPLTTSVSLSTYLFPSSVYVAMLCAFLLGFSDACFNVQIVSILGDYFSDDPAPAFGLFKFAQSLTAAIAFFYSSYLLLHWQLLILVVTATLGALTLCWAEFEAVRYSQSGYMYVALDGNSKNS